MLLLLKPIATRIFLFLYITGIVSSVITVPDYSGAHMYENAPWELFLDIYVLCSIVYIVPRRITYRQISIPLRIIAKAIIYSLTYPLYIIDTFCFVKFGTTINPSMLMLVEETNSKEASEFLSSYITPEILVSEVGVILLIILIHLVCIAYCHYRPIKWDLKINKRTCSIINLSVTALIIISLILSFNNKKMYCETMSRENISDIEKDLGRKDKVNIYQPLMRLLFAIRSNELIAKQLTRLETTVGHVKVDSCSVKSPNIVLIIGESSCKRHFQLYGYDKPNNPNQMRMERQGNLIKMDDVVAPWNLTSYVFKLLMTTYCVGDSKEWCDYPLFCEIFRMAGYHVKFFSNQWEAKANQPIYDFSGGFFINNKKLSKAQFDERNPRIHHFDSGLLKDYSKTLHSKEQMTKVDSMPQLTIFHLIGEHVSYNTRCPRKERKFESDDYREQSDLTNDDRKIMADYDNAVWYNDSIVNQIVKGFNKNDAIIIYISDHGEEVFCPGARHFFGRTHNPQISKRQADEEFRIPMWFYVTNKYKRQHPDVVKAIKAAQKKKYMTDALSHLLMGLAGIHCPYYRPQYDLLSPQYNENRKRILRNTTDYDTLK